MFIEVGGARGGRHAARKEVSVAFLYSLIAFKFGTLSLVVGMGLLLSLYWVNAVSFGLMGGGLFAILVGLYMCVFGFDAETDAPRCVDLTNKLLVYVLVTAAWVSAAAAARMLYYHLINFQDPVTRTNALQLTLTLTVLAFGLIIVIILSCRTCALWLQSPGREAPKGA